MSDKSIVLSISILISGRKEMRRCLESLRPFLKKLPCELILVDTGCNEEELDIAKEYTDIIVPFTWCKDFSAARNVGLKEAKGEWFLFLDDDEWFADPTEIVDFFLTGEYKNYNSARYFQRNYTVRQGVNKPYVDNVVLRMTKIFPETRFHGIIHEYLTPSRMPVKDFDAYVEHYGYIFDDEKDKYRHVERNASLLWKQIEMEPDSLRWYSQLIQEYMGIQEYEKVIDLCEKARAIYDKVDVVDNTQVRAIGSIFGFAATAYLNKYAYEGAHKWAQEGIEDNLLYDCAKAYLHLIESMVYQREDKHRECLESFLAYMKLYREKGQDKNAIAMETMLVNNTVFQERPMIQSVLRGLLAATKLHDSAVLEEYFYTLDWTDKRLFGQEEWERELLKYACEEPDEKIVKIIKTLGEREFGILELAPIVAQQEQEYRENGQEEYLWNLREIAARIESDHQYVLSRRIFVAEKKGETEELQGLFEKIFERCEVVFVLEKEVWEIAARHGIPVDLMLRQADFNQWRQGTEEWVGKASEEGIRQWRERIQSWKTQEDIRYDFFDMRSSEGLLYRSSENGFLTLDEQEEILWKHADRVLQYYRRLFREEIFQTLPEALPLETQLALRLKEIQRCREAGDDKGVLEGLRKCVGFYGLLEVVIDQYAKTVRDAIQQQHQELASARSEFEQLVSTLKMTASSYMQNGNYAGAREILTQVLQCVPDDAEAREWLSQIPGSEN